MEAVKTRKGPLCRYRLLNLVESDKAALDEALGRKDITGKAIEKWLAGKGIDWRGFNVNRHRRQDCGCSR